MGGKDRNILENRDEADLRALQEKMRAENLFFRLEIGTPWDKSGHLASKGQYGRLEFALDGPGCLTNAIAEAAAQMEGYIRSVLIPDAMGQEEPDLGDLPEKSPETVEITVRMPIERV